MTMVIDEPNVRVLKADEVEVARREAEQQFRQMVAAQRLRVSDDDITRWYAVPEQRSIQ